LQLQHRDRKTFFQILIGTSIGIVIYLPWLIRVPSQIGKVQSAYWIERPGIAALVQTILGFLVDLPLEPRYLGPALFLTGVVIAFACIEIFRFIKAKHPMLKSGVLVLELTFLPVLFVFLVSQIRPVYIIRGLLPSSVMLIASLAWVIARGRPLSRWTIGLSLLALFVLGIFNHLRYQGFPYAPFSDVNQYIRKGINEGEVILHTNKLTMLPAYLDDPTLPHQYLQDPPGSGSDTLAYPTQEVLGLYAEDDPLQAVDDADVVYLVIFRREFLDYQRLGYEEHPAFLRLAETYELEAKRAWEDLELYTWKFQEQPNDS
jgi:hypothetical protein